MSSKRSQLRHEPGSCPGAGLLRQPPCYLYAGLDDAPLIIAFADQLAQRCEVDGMLRHIAAVIDFELACLTRGIDPRASGLG